MSTVVASQDRWKGGFFMALETTRSTSRQHLYDGIPGECGHGNRLRPGCHVPAERATASYLLAYDHHPDGSCAIIHAGRAKGIGIVLNEKAHSNCAPVPYRYPALIDSDGNLRDC